MAETSEKITRKGDVTVRLRRGLDLRGAGGLVQIVNGYASHITIAKGRAIADARSMLDLVSLSDSVSLSGSASLSDWVSLSGSASLLP